MITEEVYKIISHFSRGDVIILTTEDDELFKDVIITGMTPKHIGIEANGKLYSIPWGDISLITEKGFTINEELAGTPRRNYDMDFMDEETMEVAYMEILALKLPKKNKMIEEEPKKFVTFGDPFTILVDHVKDVLWDRKLWSVPDRKPIVAASWYLYSGGKFGILSFDSEVIEVGIV